MNGKFVCGMYGVNINERMKGDEFAHLIADNYNPYSEVAVYYPNVTNDENYYSEIWIPVKKK